MYSERGTGVHSDNTHHFLARSPLEFGLQIIYLFQQVVITLRSAIISAPQLTLLSSICVTLYGYRSVASDLAVPEAVRSRPSGSRSP